MLNSKWLIVGGASKCGTTALHYYLDQHPELCLPRKKELHYFSRQELEVSTGGPGDHYVVTEVPDSIEKYCSYYSPLESTQVFVDVSPSYLYHYQSAGRIKDTFKTPKALFILRNPVDKIYSQYLHLLGEGRESLTFEEALRVEDERGKNHYSDMWLYKQSGYYSDAIEHFYNEIGKENVMVLYYEEFLEDHNKCLVDICNFVGVNTYFDFESVSSVNRSGKPKSKILSHLIAPNELTFFLRRIIPNSVGRRVRGFIRNFNTGKKPPLNEDTKIMLKKLYREDIQRLEVLVGRPSGWI